MGWWSKTVMGGDTPMDYECDFLIDHCGYSDFYDEDPETIRTALNQNFWPCYHHALHCVNQDGDGIALQVLGAIVLRYGANLPIEVRKVIIDAALNDEWGAEDEERANHMKIFAYQVENYTNGEPVEIATEGLFDVIASALEEGKKGLVNVVPTTKHEMEEWLPEHEDEENE